MSRGLAWWNDAAVRLIRERFVAASVPTWVARSDSPEGKFLRSAGIHEHWVTSSGYMHCLSASGRLLGTQPGAEVLEAFAKLPPGERLPGAVHVPALEAAERLIPDPPEGGVVLMVHARFLARGPDGELRHARPEDFPLMRDPEVARTWALFLQPNTECMWITREEWRSLVPVEPIEGAKLSVARSLAERMARFHLTPQRATTSEGGIVRRRDVKTAWLALMVAGVSPERIRMELEGFVHWGSEYDTEKATSPDGPLSQGFESKLHGRLEYDRVRERFTRFDLVAPGSVWGRWGDANGRSMHVERPGRAPFGFAFELAAGDVPTHRIPPGGNSRYLSKESGYFGRPLPE